MLGTKILEEKVSKFNGKLRVVKTFGMGTYIQSNGLTQSGGIVEKIWKQTLKQIKGDYNSILILGLGGGTLAKLLRNKYPNAKIKGIEIDSLMIELGKKYLDLDKYNIDIEIQDVNKFFSVKTGKFKFGEYDLVFVDMYNGDNFPKEFESDELLNKLTKFKTVIINRLYFGDKRPDTVRFGNKLEKIYKQNLPLHGKKVKWFYPEANLMFIMENN